MKNSVINKLVRSMKNLLADEPPCNPSRVTPDETETAGLEASARELETLLNYARRLSALTEQTIAALRSGQWPDMAQNLKEEYQFLEREQARLNPIILASDSGKLDGDAQVLSTDLNVNLSSIQTVFEKCSDVIIREFKIGAQQQVTAFLVMVEGLIDKSAVNESLLKSLLFAHRDLNKNNAFRIVKESALSVSIVGEAHTLGEAVEAIMAGDTVLFIDGADTALIASVRGWEHRSVKEPDTESVVRGPREGFIETLRINTALLRRRIKNPNLKLEMMTIGRQTKTVVCVAYIKGIANDKIVQEVKARLARIDTDAVLESGYIESFIEDAPFSIFATVGNSEKPDAVSAKLLEGRVAIFVDGTPFVLTVPYLLVEAFQSSEDYYSRPFYATIVRWLRWLGYGTTILLPATYVAVTTFHQELVPPALLITIAAAREGTPFPAVVEAFLMGLIYEMLREAGVRLPRPVGSAISIVGALVIGEAAVSAGLIGAPMVVITALTAISSFLVPPLADSAAIIRFLLLILAGIAGEFGLMLGIAGILTHLCSLRSFGVPYTSPLAPATLSDMKDVFVRVPWWAMFRRPRLIGAKAPVRQKAGQMPQPPEAEAKN